MPEKLKLFTKLLKAELEDLEDDMVAWGKYLDEKRRGDSISEFSFIEDAALLRRELEGLRGVMRTLSVNHPTNLPDLESIKEYYVALIRREAAKYAMQDAIVAIATKKIEKAYAYVNE